MVTRSVVQSAIHTAAMALSHLPPEEWDGWVVYLCQSLEEIAENQEDGGWHRDEIYQELMKTLRQRIERGTW
ncbi:MAG TPA: hypothetical protein PKH77_20030 [Anaerolineae bacterium]|nr:hypothetical protein [Anaerolineae bacterium]